MRYAPYIAGAVAAVLAMLLMFAAEEDKPLLKRPVEITR